MQTTQKKTAFRRKRFQSLKRQPSVFEKRFGRILSKRKSKSIDTISVLGGTSMTRVMVGPDDISIQAVKPKIEERANSGGGMIVVRGPSTRSHTHAFTSVFGQMPTSEAALTDLSVRLREATSGKLDARRLSNLLGISMTDIATCICGVTKQAVSKSPTSSRIQDKLRPLEEIAQLLLWCGGDEGKLRVWLQRPNRDFPEIEGRTPSPMDLILRGHADIVARKAHNLRTGHPA